MDPDVVAQPWCVLHLKDGGSQSMVHKWFVSKKTNKCRYNFLVSDGQNMWAEEKKGGDIERQNKELNPCMEVPVDVLLDHLSSLLVENAALTWNVEERSQKVFKLSCEARVQGFPFVWQFILKAASSEMIALHLTLPFISMVAAQERHQAELCKLIAKKDAEIQDYKLSGATVSRKHLETKVFDEASFMKDNCTKETMVQVLGDPLESACSTHLKELYKAVTEAQHLLASRTTQDAEEARTEEPTNEMEDSKEERNQSNKMETQPVVDPELSRRMELEKRLAEEEQQITAKRKKKTIKL